MNEQELKEIFKQLEEQGWKPQLCDTPIPNYDNPVKCGKPAGIGDIAKGNIMLPKEMLSMQPEFTVIVTGDSMKDANISKGDIVKVVVGSRYYDGDIVLARFDDEMTLKVYCEDDEGNPWLVPQNDNYEPIALTEEQNVWIIGKVSEILKPAPRVASRVLQKQIKKAKEAMMPSLQISQLQLSQAIREIAKEIEIGRLWYAVYRVLVDMNVIAENDFDGFCTMVRNEVPQHQHLPTKLEMQRMAVLSFAKPVARWRSDNAPVQGTRYHEYTKIAKSMEKKLSQNSLKLSQK